MFDIENACNIQVKKKMNFIAPLNFGSSQKAKLYSSALLYLAHAPHPLLSSRTTYNTRVISASVYFTSGHGYVHNIVFSMM